MKDKLRNLESFAKVVSEKSKAEQLNEKILQAKKIIKSVESDGSWGVHNFKYTEAMLRKADLIIDGAK